MHFFTQPFLKWFRSQQPSLTDAEQQVLDSGGLWWEQELFSGAPKWKHLLALKKPKLTEQEQAFLDNQTEQLCTMLNDWEIVHDDKDLPEQVWEFIKREKFWGLVIDKKYGGLGFSAIAHSAIVTKVASRSYSAALTIMVPNSLGPAEFLTHYGTSEQQQHWLPRLANGEEVPCFALTAPEAGSDATSIPDRGVVCEGLHEGKKVLGIKLNWDKRYITLAPVATLIGLAFKLDDPDQLLGSHKNLGITLALIPASHPGVSRGHRHYPLNLAFMNGPIRGEDVFIPIDWVIGGRERCGHGWQMMMECLAVGRGISLPALASASAQLCYRMTGAYALIRRQFNRSIGEFDGVREAMSRVGGFTYLCEAVRLFTAQAVDEGVRPAVASAITKYHLTELSRKIITHSMDIHGGRAIQTGPRNYLANLHDGMPTSITVEGANILTRNLIIFGQGAMRCHPYLRSEIAAASDPTDPIKVAEFDRELMAHIGYIGRQEARTIFYGLTGGRLIRAPHKGPLKNIYKQLTRMSSALAYVSDITFAFIGSDFKIKETLSARLGDVLSHLYLSSAVLKHFEQRNCPQDELVFVQWCTQYCLYQMSRMLILFCDNFPKRWVGRYLKTAIFPFSRGYAYPSDTLSFQIADAMQENMDLRERLTPQCFYNADPSDPIGRMEVALREWLACEPILEKIDAAISQQVIKRSAQLKRQADMALHANVINETEHQQILKAELARQEAIAVDEFEGESVQ